MDTHTPSSILWKQVWGIAILQSSITFSWTVYYFAQPVVLQHYFATPVGLDAKGFEYLVGALLITSGLLSLIIEPLIGLYSDKIKEKVGSRFPIINLGVAITAMIFLTVALGLRLPIPPTLAFVVPLLMVLWIASMKVFQTPAISLLWKCAPPKELAQANSVLVLIIGLVGAITPFIPDLVTLFGDSLTFVVGGVLLFVSATLMRKMNSSTESSPAPVGASEETGKMGSSQLLDIFLIGFCVTLATTPIYYIASGAIYTKLLTGLSLEYVSAGILLVSALCAIPLGKVTHSLGNNKSLLIGLASMALLYGVTSIPFAADGGANTAIGVFLILALGAGTALVFNSGIPFALSRATGSNASFATGLFFGGGGAAFALIQIFNLFYEGGITVNHIWMATVIGVVIGFMVIKKQKD